MVGYFRRAIVTAVAGVVAMVGIFVLRADARYVRRAHLSGAFRSSCSALCGIGSLLLLLRRAHRGVRLAAMGAVASIVWAWGVAQWPYILPTSLEVSAAAALSATLVTVVFGVAPPSSSCRRWPCSSCSTSGASPEESVGWSPPPGRRGRRIIRNGRCRASTAPPTMGRSTPDQEVDDDDALPTRMR